MKLLQEIDPSKMKAMMDKWIDLEKPETIALVCIDSTGEDVIVYYYAPNVEESVRFRHCMRQGGFPRTEEAK